MGLCSDPVVDVAYIRRGLLLTLDPGSYDIAGFSELKGGGPRFAGIIATVSVASGSTQTVNLPVFYAAPAKLTGTKNVAMGPKSDPVKFVKPLVCRQQPFTGGTPASDCVSTGYKATSTTSKSGTIKASGTYMQGDLPNQFLHGLPGILHQTAVGLRPQHERPGGDLKRARRPREPQDPLLPRRPGTDLGKVSVTGARSGSPRSSGRRPAGQLPVDVRDGFRDHGQDYNLVLDAGAWNVKGSRLGLERGLQLGRPRGADGGEHDPAHLTVAYQVSAVTHK